MPDQQYSFEAEILALDENLARRRAASEIDQIIVASQGVISASKELLAQVDGIESRLPL